MVKQKEVSNKIIDSTVNVEIRNEATNKKEILNKFAIGSLMGLNSVVYGSSSALFANQLGTYEKFVENMCNMFKPKSFQDFGWKLLWFLPFIISFLVSLIVMFAINAIAYFAGYELVLIFSFIGINFLGLLLFLYLPKNCPTVIINKFPIKQDKDKQKYLLIFFFVILIIIGISFIARYAWNSGFPSGHINYQQMSAFLNQDNLIHNNIPESEINKIIQSNRIETSYALQIVAAGLLCGLTSFIPGISGSFILATVGSNTYINTAVYYAFGGFSLYDTLNINPNWAWSTIVIMLIGIVTGFVCSCFITNYILNKNHNLYKSIIFGLCASTPIAVLISLFDSDYFTMGNNSVLLALSLLLMFVVIVGSIIFLWWYKPKNNFDYGFKWMLSREKE